MKQYRQFLAIALIGLSVSSCMTPEGRPDNTANGALAGGAMGAIIGSTARNPGAGAAVGAAVGALAGGAIGHSVDQAQQVQDARYAQAQQQAQQQMLPVDDIIAMSQSRISDDIIISQIRNSRTVYHLKSADIIDLKHAGVSDRVIDVMINTPSEAGSAPTASVPTAAMPAPMVEPVMVAPGPGY